MTQGHAAAPEQVNRQLNPRMARLHAGLRARAKRAVRWDTPFPRFPSTIGLLKAYLRWSRTVKFDVDLRYSVPVEFLRRNRARLGDNPRILDAGCGPYGLASVLKRECIGVDTVYPDEVVPWRTSPVLRVRASVTALPFRDRSFAFVTSMDTIEHLSPSARPAAIREIMRVSSGAVLLGVPYGPESETFNRSARAWELARGQDLDWRREHVANGLPGPELDHLVIAAGAARGTAEVRMKKHENLRFLKLRWRIGLSLPQSHLAYGLMMASLYAIAKRFHIGACYRKLYFVQFSQMPGRSDGTR